jgi:hypothetical protein
MKLSNANLYRAETIAEIMDYFTSKGEDCGMITSNAFNMPIVVNGEEGFAEITVKVTKDMGDDGYLKRQEYEIALAEKKEKAKVKAKAKAEKIARDNAKREAKAKGVKG